MLLLDRKKHGIHFYVAWFAEEPVKKSGIISYREAKFQSESADKIVPFDTLITDLTESEDEIKQHFAKNCKYEVNRAARENIEAVVLQNQEIANQDITEFCDFFVQFWASKGVTYANRDKLKKELCEYRDAGAFALGYALVNGERAVYHTYILEENCVRLLHSASLYRLSDEQEGNIKTLIGMANRYLHFEEMKYFKNIGKTVYDWGGAGKEEEVQAITKFKKSFGGTEMQYYDFEETKGIVAKMFKLLVKLLKR